jgi:putative phosphoesterase
MQPRVERRVALPFRSDGGFRFAVVADTHSSPHDKSAEYIAAQHPDAIVHAGDIGNRRVLDDLAAIAPVLAVRGNIDERAPDLPDLLTVDLGEEGGPGLRLFVLHIGVNGPKLSADAARLAKERAAEIVVCGHSHVPFIGRDRDRVVFNPGSIGPRRFHLPITFGIIDVAVSGATMWHIDCGTGERLRL